jgi:hypothetical protein
VKSMAQNTSTQKVDKFRFFMEKFYPACKGDFFLSTFYSFHDNTEIILARNMLLIDYVFSSEYHKETLHKLVAASIRIPWTNDSKMLDIYLSHYSAILTARAASSSASHTIRDMQEALDILRIRRDSWECICGNTPSPICVMTRCGRCCTASDCPRHQK